MPEKPKNFSIYLEKTYVEWERAKGARRTLSDFAEFLGVDKAVLSNWINAKRIPTGPSVALLVGKLGPTVYDALGLQRPDPMLQMLTVVAGDLSEDGKVKLIKFGKDLQAKEAAAKEQKGKGRGKLSTKPA